VPAGSCRPLTDRDRAGRVGDPLAPRTRVEHRVDPDQRQREHLLALADDFRPRKVDLGVANSRRFVFACGAGLEATAAQRVDAHPTLKARAGRWFYTYAAVSGFYRQYLRDPVRMRLEVEGHSVEGITAIAQNSDPYSYFGRQPLRVCDGVSLESGTLSLAMLRRAAQRDVPTVTARALSERLAITRHRQIEHFEGVNEARVESISTAGGESRPFPVELDGDYIGESTELELAVEPRALTVVA